MQKSMTRLERPLLYNDTPGEDDQLPPVILFIMVVEYNPD